MNKINYLLSRIKREIPIPILNLVFLNEINRFGVPTTLDYQLNVLIIKNILLQDMNIIAGKEEMINIQGCHIKTVQNGQIIEVGDGPTGGKEIMEVLSVAYGYGTGGSIKPTIASAAMPPTVVGDARLRLIGRNTVFLDGYQGFPLTGMRVVLEHDNELNDAKRTSLKFLAEMAVLATKAYLNIQGMMAYKNSVVTNGIDLPYVESVLESYADAIGMYNDNIVELIKQGIMSDEEDYGRYIRGLLMG
jgi:hypothetical protein